MLGGNDTVVAEFSLGELYEDDVVKERSVKMQEVASGHEPQEGPSVRHVGSHARPGDDKGSLHPGQGYTVVPVGGALGSIYSIEKADKPTGWSFDQTLSSKSHDWHILKVDPGF